MRKISYVQGGCGKTLDLGDSSLKVVKKSWILLKTRIARVFGCNSMVGALKDIIVQSVLRPFVLLL